MPKSTHKAKYAIMVGGKYTKFADRKEMEKAAAEEAKKKKKEAKAEG